MNPNGIHRPLDVFTFLVAFLVYNVVLEHIYLHPLATS
jgi:hypothetical protein